MAARRILVWHVELLRCAGSPFVAPVSIFDSTVHLLHGVLHGNGFGHLLRINGLEGGSENVTGMTPFSCNARYHSASADSQSQKAWVYSGQGRRLTASTGSLFWTRQISACHHRQIARLKDRNAACVSFQSMLPNDSIGMRHAWVSALWTH